MSSGLSASATRLLEKFKHEHGIKAGVIMNGWLAWIDASNPMTVNFHHSKRFAIEAAELEAIRALCRQINLLEWCDIPEYALKLASRRTGDMVSHYGRNIRAMPIETLAASCYLQGVNDCLDSVLKGGIPEPVKPVTDFQI